MREASCGSEEGGAEHLVSGDDGKRELEIGLNYSSFSEDIELEALLRDGNSRDLGAWAAFRTTSAFRRDLLSGKQSLRFLLSRITITIAS
jgi:hypothetical protein